MVTSQAEGSWIWHKLWVTEQDFDKHVLPWKHTFSFLLLKIFSSVPLLLPQPNAVPRICVLPKLFRNGFCPLALLYELSQTVARLLLIVILWYLLPPINSVANNNLLVLYRLMTIKSSLNTKTWKGNIKKRLDKCASHSLHYHVKYLIKTFSLGKMLLIVGKVLLMVGYLIVIGPLVGQSTMAEQNNGAELLAYWWPGNREVPRRGVWSKTYPSTAHPNDSFPPTCPHSLIVYSPIHSSMD